MKTQFSNEKKSYMLCILFYKLYAITNVYILPQNNLKKKRTFLNTLYLSFWEQLKFIKSKLVDLFGLASQTDLQHKSLLVSRLGFYATDRKQLYFFKYRAFKKYRESLDDVSWLHLFTSNTAGWILAGSSCPVSAGVKVWDKSCCHCDGSGVGEGKVVQTEHQTFPGGSECLSHILHIKEYSQTVIFQQS